MTLASCDADAGPSELSRTGRDVEEVTRDTDPERWLTAGEVAEYGLVDTIMAPATVPAGLADG